MVERKRTRPSIYMESCFSNMRKQNKIKGYLKI